jgi:nifR3 family TIM-barrel protein
MSHDGALKPLRIGPVEVGFPVVLASLAGYSDLPYRLVCRSAGAPFCTTEAMLDRQAILERRLRRGLIKRDPADRPLAGQIMGSDPAVMAESAAALRDMDFDVIDLNFACPVKKVLSRKRGGYLMSEPYLAVEILEAVLAAVRDRPVTVKLRRSFKEADRDNEAFWTIARAAFEAGAAGICVHARSVEHKYQGRADWGFLAEVKRAFPTWTVIGSGDILLAEDALRMLKETGVDGVSAARGAIGNPWIFRQARELAAGRPPFHPSVAEQRELLERHYRLAAETFGAERALRIMRYFGIRYSKMSPQPAKVRNAFVVVKSERDWRAVLERYFRE